MRSGERGHALAELLVAVALMGVLLAPIMSSVRSGTLAARAARERTVVLNLLRHAAEEAKAAGYDGLTLGTVVVERYQGTVYDLVYTVTYLEGMADRLDNPAVKVVSFILYNHPRADHTQGVARWILMLTAGGL